LVVTAGTIIPHLPRRAIASGSIPSWLEEGQEQGSGDAAESTDPQSGSLSEAFAAFQCDRDFHFPTPVSEASRSGAQLES
jgi:hypothetical protein